MKILKAALLGVILSTPSLALAANISLIDGSHDMVNGSGTDGVLNNPALGLVGLGHTTTKYASTIAGYDAALAANDILVIEQSAVNAGRSSEMFSYMSAGGTIIQAGGSGFALPNTWFGSSLVQVGFSTASKSAAASSGIYAPFFGDDPANLVNLSSMHTASGVPTGGTALYNNSNGTHVFHVAVGTGNYFYFGWDFCCSGTEAQRNDYYAVLDSAIDFAEGADVPDVPLPASLPLVIGGLGMLGAAGRRSRRKA